MTKHFGNEITSEFISVDGNTYTDGNGDEISTLQGVNAPRIRPVNQQWDHDMYPSDPQSTDSTPIQPRTPKTPTSQPDLRFDSDSDESQPDGITPESDSQTSNEIVVLTEGNLPPTNGEFRARRLARAEAKKARQNAINAAGVATIRAEIDARHK